MWQHLWKSLQGVGGGVLWNGPNLWKSLVSGVWACVCETPVLGAMMMMKKEEGEGRSGNFRNICESWRTHYSAASHIFKRNNFCSITLVNNGVNVDLWFMSTKADTGKLSEGSIGWKPLDTHQVWAKYSLTKVNKLWWIFFIECISALLVFLVLSLLSFDCAWFAHQHQLPPL